MNVALYALSSTENLSLIKIGRITGSINTILSQYSSRYNPQGYQIFRYWFGLEYYSNEHAIQNHPKLLPSRITNNKTGKLTEWFATTLDVIDDVVYEVITNCRNNPTTHQQIHTTPIPLTLKISPTNINQIGANIFINGDKYIVGDIYYNIMLTSNIEDGPIEYLKNSLITNFQHMFPPSRRSSANVYTLISDALGNPKLLGLIRYDRGNFPPGTRISVKSNIINNNIKSFYTGAYVTNRQYTVVNLTVYKNKMYLTKQDTVVEVYNLIQSSGTVTGDPLENFLQVI